MNVEKRYSCGNNGKLYVTFTVNDYFYGGIIRGDKLFDKGTSAIDINNLNNEEFLKKNDIVYLKELNSFTNETQIIPIGLFEFDGSDNYMYSSFMVYNHDGKDLYKMEQIIKNIEKAIRIKYEVLKLKNKCKNVTVEQVQLETVSLENDKTLEKNNKCENPIW